MALERNPDYVEIPMVAGGADGLEWFRNPTAWHAKNGTPLVRHESLPRIPIARDEYDEGGEFDSGGHDDEV